MLVGFFKTKHQNGVLKAFLQLRDYRKASPETAVLKSQKTVIDTTARTFPTFTLLEDYHSRIKSTHSARYLGSIPSQQNLRASRQSTSDLQQLLSRVKDVNSKS